LRWRAKTLVAAIFSTPLLRRIGYHVNVMTRNVDKSFFLRLLSRLMSRWWPPEERPPAEHPCPECGHDVSAHPYQGHRDLSACAECVWEEDHDRRSDVDISHRHFDRKPK
jgi:hypothetical protein